MEMNHVLVVEDDKEIREGVEIYLKSQGYEVFQAADGIEHPPVLQIKTTDTTIFLNSSNEAQTKEWYDQLNDAISSNK